MEWNMSAFVCEGREIKSDCLGFGGVLFIGVLSKAVF